MSKNRRNEQLAVLDVPVQFGGVSIGESTARLGVKINRDVLNIVAADEVFCGHRLSGRVLLGQHDDAAGQMKLIEDVDVAVNATFDCKRLGVSAMEYGIGLTFSLSDIDISELARFSKGSGRLTVDTVAELPDDDDDDANDHVPGTLKASEAEWAKVPLDTLFDGALLKSLKKAGLNTVGGLSEYTASDRRLTDIEGIGPGKAELIENTMLNFWSDNPQYSESVS
jgi:hypothetical protein